MQGGCVQRCEVVGPVSLGAAYSAVQENRVATLQSLSGTGSLRVAAEFIAKFLPGKTVYLSNPTWGNHKVRGSASAILKWPPHLESLLYIRIALTVLSLISINSLARKACASVMSTWSSQRWDCPVRNGVLCCAEHLCGCGRGVEVVSLL